MIQAVIFDVDGVLLDSFEANLKFFQDLMAKFGYQQPSRETYLEVFHLTMLKAIRTLTGLTDEVEIKKIWEAGKRREVPYQISLINIPERTEEVLQKLRNQYALGIASSRITRESIYEAPQLAALQKYFDVAVSASDTTNHKPDPEPLLLCAAKLGVSPEQCVYVGDVENDVLAAKAARMKAIIYSKNQIEGADRCTSLFHEIPELIKTLDLNIV